MIIGVTETGHKKVLAVEGGYRESAESWKIVFNSLINRGMTPPMLIIGDGALGLWKAVDQLPDMQHTKTQRCWVHKISNILDKLPKRLQPQAKKLLHDMMQAESEAQAEAVKEEFIEDFQDKYPKVTNCLTKDWQDLVTFFSFPAKHWLHIRTTNPIESTFATVKQRTRATKGAGSVEMAETMALKLILEAQKRWHRLRGFEELRYLVQGGLYKDGILVDNLNEGKAVNG